MDKKTQVQAWRSKSFRDTLRTTTDHPAGIVDLQDDALKSISGGCGIKTTFVSSCVNPPYQCP